MIEINALAGQELVETKLNSAGLYILQSESDPSLYRIGETKNLASRRGNHRSGAPKQKWKNAPNWTEIYRPWKMIWGASIAASTHLSLKMCEHHLHSVFAREYEFVDTSGFEAPADEAEQLIALANAQIPILRDITRIQRRPKFDKEAYFREAWPD